MSTPAPTNLRLCASIKVDGKRCGGPAVTGSDYCHHHENLKVGLNTRSFELPSLDDPNAIQVATMQVMNALITGKVSRADAYALFQGLHLARANMKSTTLSPPTPHDLEEMLANARAEGRAEGLKEGRRQAIAEREREEARRGEEDNESLAAFLMRELTAPPESN